MPTSRNFSYMFLNLVGEVGEFASKVAKYIRKDQAYIDYNKLWSSLGDNRMTEGDREQLRKEAGDILWQLAGTCEVMGWSLEEVARENLDKLAQRKANHTIDGNGDGVTKEERL